MSLLGFDAIGRLALGQIQRPTTIVLSVSAANYAITASAVLFKIAELVTQSTITIAGVENSEQIKESVATASFLLSTSTVSFKIVEPVSAASYVVTPSPVNLMDIEPVLPGSIVISPLAVPLTRTGFDYDFQQGGVGHLLYEALEAKRLAAITRRGPPGFVDLRSQPSFGSFGGPPVAAAAPPVNLQAVAEQRAAAQQQAAQEATKRRRRDEEAIVLLAS